MNDWVVLDESILVQVVGGWLMVAPGQWVEEEQFAFCPNDVIWVMPGRPMCDLTPLNEHQNDIRRLIQFD